MVLLVVGAISMFVLDRQQRAWIFQPRTSQKPISAASAGAADVWIAFRSASAKRDVQLHGLWLPQTKADAPVLLYLHGARWDVRASEARMGRMHSLGFSVLGIDYRGFGRSSPALPSEKIVQEDAQAAWDWLAERHPKSRRFIFGHSLGGAIAVQLSVNVKDDAGLLLEGTFSSIPDVVKASKWGWLPVDWLITQRFDSLSRIDRVGVPVLVVHGGQDKLIPAALGRDLYQRAAEPKRFELVQGGAHHSTNVLGQTQYRRALRDLFGFSGG
ncbi:MAG: alpha/beta fold hydrolase [Rhizobacter sp.]